MRHLHLQEHQRSDPLELSRDELAALIGIQSLRIEPTGTPDEYVVTPGSEVGALELPRLSVVIEPKLPIDRVLFLTSFALDPRRWRAENVELRTRTGLVEALIPAFVAQARRAFARGVLQGYRTAEESSMIVRGRILFDEQLRRWFGRTPPVEVRFDDFTEDIDANRLVKAAARRLGRMRIRSDASRRSLNLVETTLERVRLVEYQPSSLPEITYTRLNEHYRPVVELAKLILRSTSLELGRGERRASGFLLDMNKVFENFVVVALRESLGLSERSFPQGQRCPPLHLADRERVRLRPDISWWDADRCTFVGDVKYKRLTLAGYENADLYQLHAYATAAGLPGGILVYAKGERPKSTYTVRHVGTDLQVVTLTLHGTTDAILAQVDELAARVRSLRQRANASGSEVAA